MKILMNFLSKKIQSEIHKSFTQEELQILWNNIDNFELKIALILRFTGLRPSALLENFCKEMPINVDFIGFEGMEILFYQVKNFC